MEIANTSDLVTINICELSSELANKRLVQYYEQFYPSKTSDEIEDMILIEHPDNESLTYTDHAQDLFNQLYHEYYSLIEKLAI